MALFEPLRLKKNVDKIAMFGFSQVIERYWVHWVHESCVQLVPGLRPFTTGLVVGTFLSCEGVASNVPPGWTEKSHIFGREKCGLPKWRKPSSCRWIRFGTPKKVRWRKMTSWLVGMHN